MMVFVGFRGTAHESFYTCIFTLNNQKLRNSPCKTDASLLEVLLLADRGRHVHVGNQTALTLVSILVVMKQANST